MGLRRRQPVISFGIAFVCITLLPSSNFIVAGGNRARRANAVSPECRRDVDRGRDCGDGSPSVCARAVVTDRRLVHAPLRRCWRSSLLTGATRSALRTRVWRDNDTLFRQAVIDSPLAYRAHYMLGAWDFENKRKRDGEIEYRKALNLFPYDPSLSYNMAEQYRNAGLCGPAIPLYRWTRGLEPYFPLGHSAFAWCLLNEGLYDEAKLMALDAMRSGADLKAMRRIMFLADSAKASDVHAETSSPVAVAGGASKLRDSLQKAVEHSPIRRTR